MPPGQTSPAVEETVNPGDHFEVSDVIALYGRRLGRWPGRARQGRLHRPLRPQPDLDGQEGRRDEAWVRFGVEPPPATLAPRGGVYLKIGKFPKFERQNDRHLESYGLVSTAFNRLEDAGAELGLNLGRHFYAKLTGTPRATPCSCATPTPWPATTAPPSCGSRTPTRPCAAAS